MSHLTVAVSEKAFKNLFEGLRDGFTLSSSDSVDLGPFSAHYAVAMHLEGGDVDLRNDGTVKISELDIKWDTLSAGVGFDIPEICIGGWCIIPSPFGCILRVPRICVFSADPDIDITVDLSGVITSEVSVTARPIIRYFNDPGRAGWMSDLDAEDAGVPNKWQVFIDPETVDIDVFDVSDIVGDLLENAITAAINALLPGPQWLKDIILAILGPIIDLIRAILDLPDDIGEWLSDLLGVSLGLFNVIVNAVADYFAAQMPNEFEDPFPLLGADASVPWIQVKIPIRDLAVTINDREMILEGNVGA
jgi:hypothetical protein